MDFKNQYPDFASVETHILRARAQRSVHLAHVIAGLVAGLGSGLKHLSQALGSGLAAERDRRAIEADAFLKRSVPRY
ncbi:MAG: hypothetical protein ACXWG1_00455 [Usitatibacter sp.]